MHNPRRLRRIGLGLVAAGALLASSAAVIRDRVHPGTTAHSSTYLIDVIGWLFAIAGAVAEARVGDLLLNAGLRRARTRAVLFTCIGLGAGIGACVTISLESSGASASPLRAALAALMVGGLGVGFGGAATLAWFYGGSYAGHRIERMGNDDW